MPRSDKPRRLYLKRGVFYGWYFDHQRQDYVYKSTGCRDEAAAQLVQLEWERIAANPRAAAAQRTSLSDVIMMRRTELEQLAGATPPKKSWATVKFFEEKATQLVRVLEHERDSSGGVLPCTCTSGDCQAYLPLKLAQLEPPQGAELVDWYIGLRRSEWVVRPRRADHGADGELIRPAREGRHVSEHSIGKELVVLRSVLKLAKRRGLWSGDCDAVLPVGFAPEYEPVERWLPRGEVKKLMAELTQDRAARVAFMVGAGAEWNATERALREDIAEDLSAMRIRGTKRKTRDRVVHLVMQWQRELVGFARGNGEGHDGALFAPWQNRVRDIKAACERAGIELCSPNDLRRTCMTWLRAEGVLPSEIAPFAGHVDSRMVERVYGRLNPEQLAAVMEGRASRSDLRRTTSGPNAPGAISKPDYVPSK